MGPAVASKRLPIVQVGMQAQWGAGGRHPSQNENVNCH